ncbi:MAG: TIGR02099 family protein [Gammaproteobacteria bacterium]|nr:TIGR02099 family protein [Gammaproteobacteria bacterium]
MLKRICLIALNKLLQFIAVILITFAVLVTLAKYITPTINDYRSSIEKIIIEQSGFEISIGKIEGNWESVGPVFELYDIQIGPHSTKASERNTFIKSIKISIATFPSIFYRTLVTDKLVIDGFSIIIDQEQSGKFSFSNISKTKNTGINQNFAASIQDWLQHQHEIQLLNTHIEIGLRNELKYPIKLDEIQFTKGNDLYQLIGHSKLPGRNQIDFVFEVDDFLNNPAANGQLYVDTHRIDMTELPLYAIWKEADIESGLLELKIWADWKNGRFESALLVMEVDDFLMSLLDEPQTHLNKMDTFLVWQRTEKGWLFESHQTEIISQDRVWPDPSLFVQMDQDSKQRQYNISISHLDLGILTDLVLTNSNLESNLRQQLLTMNPNGFLNDNLIKATVDDKKLTSLRANALFSEITWKPWGKIPGVTNFAGQFEIHENYGELIVDSRNSVIDYPGLFRWPFEVNSINSRFSWKITDELVALQLSNFDLDITDVKLKADGLFNIYRNSKPVEMNLYAELEDGNVSKTRFFLPNAVMKENLVNYLDQSIKSGKLEGAQIALRGPATSFPFANPEGIFSINAQVTDTQYKFTEGWPILENISADLWFVEKGMDIRISEGTSNGQIISSASAVIKNLKAKPALLQIRTKSSGDAKDGISYINNSPLKNSIGPIFEYIPTQGPFGLELDLEIPLVDKVDVTVNGQVDLLGNSITVVPVDMAIDNIKGNIKISDSLISADKLSADVMGDKSFYQIEQLMDSKIGLVTNVLGKGNFTTVGVRKVFPDWIPKMLEGKSEFDLKLSFPSVPSTLLEKDMSNEQIAHTQLIMDLEFNTALKGIRSNFPEPFNKKAEQLEKFTLNYKLLKNQQQLFVATLSDRADIKLHIADQQSPTGQIVLGGDKAVLSRNEKIEITGKLSQFDLESWLTLFQQQPVISLNNFEFTDYNNFIIKNLQVEDFRYHFLDFENIDVSAAEKNNTLQFKVDSKNILGNIIIPNTDLNMPIDFDLTHISIADQFPVSEIVENKEIRVSNYHPLPAMKIHCESCVYNNKSLGKTTINLTPLINGNAFTVKMGKSDILSIDIDGQWQKDNVSSHVLTRLSGKLKTGKLGALLNTFNLKTGIHKTKLSTEGDISWEGDLGQFNFDTLNGSLSFKGGKGSQEDISDKGARIFSLFSVGSLARRLTLDFSDLFGDGFYYDSLSGSFAITNGSFATTNFEIDGTSADLEIKGSSDFTNNRIEECVRVTPELSSSLPILAGWAIEPVTGIVVYLMSKIFQPAIKVVTSILYTIEGPIDAPIVKEFGKTSGTAVVDNSGEKEIMTITPDAERPTFTCKYAFEK